MNTHEHYLPVSVWMSGLFLLVASRIVAIGSHSRTWSVYEHAWTTSLVTGSHQQNALSVIDDWKRNSWSCSSSSSSSSSRSLSCTKIYVPGRNSFLVQYSNSVLETNPPTSSTLGYSGNGTVCVNLLVVWHRWRTPAGFSKRPHTVYYYY